MDFFLTKSLEILLYTRYLNKEFTFVTNSAAYTEFIILPSIYLCKGEVSYDSTFKECEDEVFRIYNTFYIKLDLTNDNNEQIAHFLLTKNEGFSLKEKKVLKSLEDIGHFCKNVKTDADVFYIKLNIDINNVISSAKKLNKIYLRILVALNDMF